MKIRGRLTFRSEDAGELAGMIARSLASDNVPGIQTVVEEGSATVTFSADRVGTMLSSVDDYLMNAKIAEDMIENIRRKGTN